MHDRRQKRIVATIEARMTSSRLPGKVLMKSCGRPLLWHMIERIRRCKSIDEIVVATTVNETDNPIVDMCNSIGCKVFRGSEDDVMGRVLCAAETNMADVIVETTGDCPLIDWRHIDYLVNLYKSSDYDYVANNTERSFPDGFDIRIFSTTMLREAYEVTKDPLDHEHVSIFFPNRPNKYKCYNWHADGIEDRPDIAVTLDEEGDYKLINEIYESLYPRNRDFSCKDVMIYIDTHPEVMRLVEGISRTEFDYKVEVDNG